MILVFPDIHGCFDAFKALYSQVKFFLELGEASKVIVLGDYIDHGPSSKEVVDFIRAIPHEKVLLMGNHEDLLLMYHLGSKIFESYGNQWCSIQNGGLDTVRSFDPESKLPSLILEESGWWSGNASDTYIKNDGIFHLAPHYEEFFLNLKYIHSETIELPEGKTEKYLFSHGVPNPKIPLSELFSVQNFEAFHQLNEKYNIAPDGSNVWGRSFLDQRIEDHVLIHGHTPTHLLADYYAYELNPDETLKKSLSAAEAYYRHIDVEGEYDPLLVQIDLDTGAVYGKQLTAMLLLNHPKEFEDEKLQRYHGACFYLDLSKGFKQNRYRTATYRR